MSDGTTFKLCGCRDEGTGRLLGRKCPKLRRGNGWSPVHGTWYYQLELPPRADGTRRRARCATAASPPDRRARPSWTWPGNCWPSPPPGDLRTAIRIADAITAAMRDTRTLPDPGRVRKQVGAGRRPRRPPARRRASGSRNGWPPRRSCGPAPSAATAGHIRLYLKPHLGHIPIDRLRVTDISSMFDHIEELNDAIAEARASGSPASARRRQGTPAGRPGHLPADPRHPPLGAQHLHEAAPRRAARQRRLPRRAAPRHPAQGAGLDRRAGPRLAEGLRRPAGRRPRGRRAGQPGRHLDLRARARRRSWSGPPPRPWSSSKPPAATGCTRCGG